MFRAIPNLALMVALPPLFFTLCWGQNETLRIDSGHSTASLTLVSSNSAASLNVGIAKVSGTIRLNSKNPAEDVLDLNIYPARQGSRLLNSDGSFRRNSSANLSRFTLLSFHSERSQLNREGKLVITGELTITYAERRAKVVWNNAYSGPEY